MQMTNEWKKRAKLNEKRYLSLERSSLISLSVFSKGAFEKDVLCHFYEEAQTSA
jgi:hypothetical protein